MKYLLQASHCLLLIILTACSSTNKSNSKSGHVTTVSTEKAMRTNISSYIKTIGITVSDYTINIRPQVSGQLLKTHFSDGQWVKKGDLLYSIDPRLFEASLKEAEARVQSAQAELKTTQLKYNRSLELEKSKFISKQDLQDIEAQLATAKANLTTAKAEKYKAEVELGYTKIHAAMDGKTSMHFVDMGNIISPSMPTPLATLIDMDPIYFHLVIPQSEFETFKAFFEKNKEKNQNTIAHIELQDGKSKFKAQIYGINNALDRQSGVLKISAFAKNSNRNLFPGQFVNAKIFLDELPNAVLVPNEAVQINQKGEYVYIVNNNKTVSLKPVKTGQLYKNNTKRAILSGLKSGDRVITKGQLSLYEGAKIRIYKQNKNAHQGKS